MYLHDTKRCVGLQSVLKCHANDSQKLRTEMKKSYVIPQPNTPIPAFQLFFFIKGGCQWNPSFIFLRLRSFLFFMLPPHRKMASSHLTFSSVGDVREAARKERKNPFFLIFHSYVLRKEIQTTGEKCDSSIHYLYTSHTRGLLDYISMRPWRQRSHPSWHEHLNDWPYNWSKIQMENWG